MVGIFDNENKVLGFFRNRGPGRGSRFRTKLLIALLPSVVGILLVTGLTTYRLSSDFLNIALERIVRVQTLAMAHAVERLLRDVRRDLLLAARFPVDERTMRHLFASLSETGGTNYREISFLSLDGENTIHLLRTDEGTTILSPANGDRLEPGILQSPGLDLADMRPGVARLSDLMLAEYAHAGAGQARRESNAHIYRMAALAADATGRRGLLVVGLDAAALRNVLSLYNSPKSPTYAFPRTPELRFSYFFDPGGWTLFQSEDLEKPDEQLGTYLARAGLHGTLGRPGMPAAFRPAASVGHYWKMIADVKDGRNDTLLLRNEDESVHSETKHYFLAYAPVALRAPDGTAEKLLGGICYIDRSRLTLVAGYKQIDVMFLITLGTIAVVASLIYLVSRRLARPLLELTREVNAIQASRVLEPVKVRSSDFETTVLRNAINNMIATMRRQMEEIRQKDHTIHLASLKARADLDGEAPRARSGVDAIPEIVGKGPLIEKVKADVVKAAQVGVDVLIMGETGTGKQLVAEAIHNYSTRAGGPFISINCGALDENLLLDTLFGHVKGAFTEAKTDRKGAFQEASGGTLFLDEIQSASAKVQQALLRAIAMRRIRPLGSDKEVEVDVRLVAATNVDLSELSQRGGFRQDLYFRLKVISIRTPALREQPENIPVLAAHFLHRAEEVSGRQGLAFSRGAVERMRGYRWPGNIRELENSVLRSAVMSEGKTIQAEDLYLEGESLGPELPDVLVGAEPSRAAEASARMPDDARAQTPDTAWLAAEPAEERPSGFSGARASAAPPDVAGAAAADALPAGVRLNERQLLAWPLIATREHVTRNDYQAIIGGGLSSRTANYDLQDLESKGLLTRVGKGPATRYEPKRAARRDRQG